MAESLGTAILHLTVGSKGLVTGLARAQGQTRTAMAAMAATGSMLTKGLTLPIAAAGIASGKMAMDYESSLSQITGLVGVSKEQVTEWGDTIIGLGPKVGKTPKELADAMFFITSAGLRGSDAMDTLEASAKASAAGLGETKVIADAVTSAMNAYGPETLSAGQATDILTNAVREGKLEADQLAPAIGKVIPLASAMGVPFNDVAAALASMSRTGTDAATASTQVRAILAGLVKPSVDSAKAMEELGTSQDEVRKSIREKGLLATLKDLQERAGGNEEVMARLFPNIRALSGVLDMLGSSSKTTDAIFKSLANSTGITDKAFQDASETTEFKMAQAMSALQGAAIMVGSVVLPIFARIAEGVAWLAVKFTELPAPVRTGIVVFAGLAAVLGPLILLFLAMISPIGLVVMALAGLVAAIVYGWQTSETFRAIVHGVFAWFQAFVPAALSAVATAAQQAWNWIRTTLAPVAAFIMATWNQVSSAVRRHWNEIKATITTIWNGVRQFLTTTLNGLRAIWSNIWDQIKVTVQQVWDLIKVVVRNGLNIIGNAIRLVMAVIRGDWSAAWSALKALVGSVMTAIKEIVGQALRSLAIIAVNLAKNVAKAIWNGIKTVGSLLGDLLGLLKDRISGAISSVASAAFGWAAEIGKQIVSGVVSGLGGLASAVKNKVQSAVSSALSNINPFSPVEHGGEIYIGEPIVEGALTGIAGMAGSIRRSLEMELGRAVPQINLPRFHRGPVNHSDRRRGKGDGAIFEKVADTVHFHEPSDANRIIGDLGNRVMLRMGAV